MTYFSFEKDMYDKNKEAETPVKGMDKREKEALSVGAVL